MGEFLKRLRSVDHKKRKYGTRATAVLAAGAMVTTLGACSSEANKGNKPITSGIVYAMKDHPETVTTTIIKNFPYISITPETWEIDFEQCPHQGPCKTNSKNVSERRYKATRIGQYFDSTQPDS